MVDTAHAKLVTIIFSSELQDRIVSELHRLGATGYSVTRVDGRGHHGPRTRNMFDIGNARLETIVPLGKADAILAHLVEMQRTENADLVAFVQDVEAIPRKHFV
jgi:nitrogen regulatory protein P-II 2